MTRDDGAAAVWAVALTSLLLVVLLAVATVADLLAARQRAAAAADLAALAAAPYAATSPALACREAASVALANDASLEACEVSDGDVKVDAAVTFRGPWRHWVSLLALPPAAVVRARAGLR